MGCTFRAQLALATLLGLGALAALLIHQRPRVAARSEETVAAWEVEDHLGWHRAVLNTLIRQNRSLKSPVVQMLPMGRFVHVLERQGRRVKIDFPAKGWTSITTPKGEPILMWDAPEAEHKSVWSLPREQRTAVFESREMLRKNQAKEKQAQHDKLLKKGMLSLVRRYQSGALQKDLERRFSIENIHAMEGELESGIEKVGNATQQVLKVLSRNDTDIKGFEDALNDTGLLNLTTQKRPKAANA